MKSWTAPGPDMIQTHWLRKLTVLHDHLAAQVTELLKTDTNLDWLTGCFFEIVKQKQNKTKIIFKQKHT